MSRETEGADTLEDWRQAAKVEAALRREAHAEIERLRSALDKIARPWPWSTRAGMRRVAREALNLI